MRAAVFHGKRDVRLAQRPVPAPGPGELLVRVATAGICGTDVAEYARGPVMFPIDRPDPATGHSGPMVPGHEFSGYIAGVGSGVVGFAEGELVASGAGVWCGRCGPCGRGRTNLCEHYWTVGIHRDGALADYVSVPAAACLSLAGRRISADLAALAQPMSIALHAVRRGDPAAGQEVAVLGTGGIGMFVCCALARLGAAVTAVDLDPDRLQLAARLGVARTITAIAAAPLLDQLRDQIAPPQLVFECTGTAGALRAALSLTGPGARIVVVGHQAQPVELDFRLVSLGERELTGTMAHAFRRDYADAVDLVAADPPVWTDLAPVVRPLTDIVADGLRPLSVRDGQQIKYLFDPALTAPRPLRTGP
ncbi:MAG TPA: alcohol dehydrogenase catalytic domain-containing protein [Mycobacteriales bacterium]|nr:alcohol dehydrogenase catalytic domain-containing protein [Mycobacteriales bacterium]